MSHFSTLVFFKKDGKSIEELLEPYDEKIEVKPYIKYTKLQAIEKVRKEIVQFKNTVYSKYLADPKQYEKKWGNNSNFIKYLNSEFPQKLNGTDEECYEEMKKNFDENQIDSEGNIFSTDNPNSKWDWYCIGGRWENSLKTKSGKSITHGCVTQIDWSSHIPFAFITSDGEWHERGKIGCFASMSNEKDKDTWKKEYLEYVSSLDEDTYVAMIDCRKITMGTCYSVKLKATEIQWDTDGDEEIFQELPKEMIIPDYLTEYYNSGGKYATEEISDWLSLETGFCHCGFKLIRS